MSEVIEINDIETLGDYRLLWDSLLPETPHASFFQTYDWLKVYWKHFGEGQRLRVLIVRAAGKPIGIVPLCVRRQVHKLGSVRVLTYPMDNWGMFYGPLGKNQAATLMAAMKHIARTPRDWEEIDLPWIADDRTDNGRTRRAMQFADLSPRTTPYQSSSVVDMRGVDMEGTWDEYLAGREHKVRHELRRNLRRIERLGNVEFVRHRPAPYRDGDGDSRWEMYQMCEEVSRASWQATSTTGNTLCHPRVRDFCRDAHAIASKLGMVDMALLKLDGEPVAFAYNYHYQSRVFGLRMGYDASVPAKGLGKALLTYQIRDGFERGDACLVLGTGNEEYKHRIRTGVETSSRLTFTPVTAWRPQIIRASHWLRRVAMTG